MELSSLPPSLPLWLLWLKSESKGTLKFSPVIKRTTFPPRWSTGDGAEGKGGVSEHRWALF